MTYPSGRVVNLARNSQGQVTGLSEVNSGVTQNLLSNASYVPYGNAKQYTLGNGKTVTKTHNLNGQLTSIDVPGIYQNQLSFNADSNITALQNATEQLTFDYDALDRLKTANGSFGNLGYAYDATGNRQSKTTDGQVDALSYNPASNQLAGQFIHDATGNRTEDPLRQYTYADNNRLKEATNKSSQVKTNYVYNALGQRVQKQNVFGTVLYLYDESGLLIAEADSTGKVVKEYVYFEGQLLAMLVGE
jgi:YD repeat-containing protein